VQDGLNQEESEQDDELNIAFFPLSCWYNPRLILAPDHCIPDTITWSMR